VRYLRPVSIVIALTVSLVGTGCRSSHVDVSVENRTGEAIRLLEVSYPSASFGADSLAAGATLRNRIQLRGDGPVKVTFAGARTQFAEITGPVLAEKQNGILQIVLLGGGKADFHPDLHSPQ